MIRWTIQVELFSLFFQQKIGNYDFFIFNNNRIAMEEYNLEVKAEFEQIFKVLSKQQHDKMPFEGIQIAKSLSRLPFFRRYFDTNSENFINLCIAQDAIIVSQGTSIYAKQAIQGRQRYIYVILQGSFSASSQQCPKKHLGMIRIFGQTQILFGLEGRKETVIALENSKVMRIKETAILKIFNKRDEIKKCLHFMHVNQYFQELKKLEKMQLALSMVRRPFQKGSILKSEGQKMQEVFFFIYGKVEVTTHINKNSKDKEYIIDYLQELSTFGEYEGFTGIGTALKLSGVISGAYYSLNYAEIKRENHRIAQIIEQNAIPYPSNEQLQFLQGVKSTLKNEQKRVIKGPNYNR